MASTEDGSTSLSSIQLVLIGVSVSLLIVAMLTAALLTYHPTAVSTLMHFLSSSRLRRGLAFGPPVHRPCYTTDVHSWAERVLQALRDRRDATSESGMDVTNSSEFVYISDPPDFDYLTTCRPLH